MIVQFEPMMTENYAKAVYEQIVSNWIGFGPRIDEFEEALAKYVNVHNAVAVSSGTAALMIAMVALGIGEGTKVVLPDYSFIAAANVLRFLKADFILVDINKDTLCLDVEGMKEACSKYDVEAVVFINHNGYVGEDLLEVVRYCKQFGIKLIEDSACAFGQWYNGKHAGTFGDIGCFSFSTPKVLTTGQGGMVITNDENLALECRKMVDQGSVTWRKDGYHEGVGLNFKFNDVLAALGMAQFETLDKIFAMRRDNYSRFIENGLDLHYYPADINNGPWMNILMDVPAKMLMGRLSEHDIQSKMYYRPTHRSIGMGGRSWMPKSWLPYYCPEADRVYERTLYLPSSFNLKTEDIDYICRTVEDTLKEVV